MGERDRRAKAARAVADGTVYGDTSSSVFALDAATGKVRWNDPSLLNSGQGAFEIQPPARQRNGSSRYRVRLRPAAFPDQQYGRSESANHQLEPAPVRSRHEMHDRERARET